MKNTLAFYFILISASAGFAQFSASYYHSNFSSKIGAGYNYNDRFWNELRLLTNTPLESITPEFVVGYNFVHQDRHNVYAGLGGILNGINGVSFPVGVQFTPLKSFDRFFLQMEFQPLISDADGVLLLGSWGIKYFFGDAEE